MLLLCGWSQTRRTQLLIAHFWRAAAFIETMRNGCCAYAILLYLTARLTLCLWIGRTSERAHFVFVTFVLARITSAEQTNPDCLWANWSEAPNAAGSYSTPHLSTSQWQLWHAWLFSAVYFQTTEPRIYWKRMVVKMREVKSLPAACTRKRNRANWTCDMSVMSAFFAWRWLKGVPLVSQSWKQIQALFLGCEF